jgi:hypothetical protein
MSHDAIPSAENSVRNSIIFFIKVFIAKILYKINKKKDRKQIFLKRCLILGIFVADFRIAYLFYADYYGVFPNSSLFLANTTPLSKKNSRAFGLYYKLVYFCTYQNVRYSCMSGNAEIHHDCQTNKKSLWKILK